MPAIPPPVHTFDEVTGYFETRVLPEMDAWVIEHDGEIVALLVLSQGWIEQFYVDPAHTGRGLGTRLVDVAKSRHPDGLDLWTFQANLGARRFYERHGFVPVATTEGDNEEGAPDVRYHWAPAARMSS